MISALVRRCGQLMDTQVPETWRWRGRPVRLIDGTTVSMPDTLANQETYPQQGGQRHGLGFPICPPGWHHMPIEWCCFECGYGKF